MNIIKTFFLIISLCFCSSNLIAQEQKISFSTTEDSVEDSEKSAAEEDFNSFYHSHPFVSHALSFGSGITLGVFVACTLPLSVNTIAIAIVLGTCTGATLGHMTGLGFTTGAIDGALGTLVVLGTIPFYRATRKLLSKPTETQQWNSFIEKLWRERGEHQNPHPVVERLLDNHLHHDASGIETSSVLDLGCELAKNAKPFARRGWSISLIDISPRAIELSRRILSPLLRGEAKILSADAISLTQLSPGQGNYRAVVGTYVFSFVPCCRFEEVMKNIFSYIQKNGYFAGGFFGDRHGWVHKFDYTFIKREELVKLFTTSGFILYELSVEDRMTRLVDGATSRFHTLEVIAQRQ